MEWDPTVVQLNKCVVWSQCLREQNRQTNQLVPTLQQKRDISENKKLCFLIWSSGTNQLLQRLKRMNGWVIYAIQLMCFEKGRRALWNQGSHYKKGSREIKWKANHHARQVSVLWLTATAWRFHKQSRNKNMSVSSQACPHNSWKCFGTVGANPFFIHCWKQEMGKP